MSQDLILIGRQGSGKGTQGKILAEMFGYKIFVTGDELRAIAKEDSELGREVKAITERGDLVSNEIVMAIVANFIQNLEEGVQVIFDGIPRSMDQRETLEEELKKAGRDFVALEIRLSTDEAFERLMKRAELEGRADDNPDSIRKRIANFEEHTAPIIKHWDHQEKLISVDGNQAIDDVTQEILTYFQVEGGCGGNCSCDCG